MKKIFYSFMLFSAIFIFAPKAMAVTTSTQGPNNPSVANSDASNGSTISWTTPSNANLVDATSTDAFLDTLASGKNISQYLKLTGFGFNIPSGSSITGITVSVTRRAASSASIIKDDVVSLVAPSVTSISKADTSTTWLVSGSNYETKIYGSDSDTWSRSWSASEINSSSFGLILSVKNFDGSKRHVYVDGVTIFVTYTKANQTITVTSPNPTNTSYNSSFTVSASSTSALPVSITSSGGCSGSGTSTASILITSATTNCSVFYNQLGDNNYEAAPTVQQDFTVSKANQTIYFEAIADKVFGGSDFSVNASTTFNLPVSFTASGTCSVISNLVHITGAGVCEITASQSGDSNVNAASNVIQTFNIAQKSVTVTPDSNQQKIIGQDDPVFSYTLSDPAVFATGTLGRVAGEAVGNYDFTLGSLETDLNHTLVLNPSSPQFTINKKSQTITFEPLLPVTYGDGDFSLSASSTSNLPVSLAATGDCSINSGVAHILSAGICKITASQNGNDEYLPATDVAQDLTINKLKIDPSLTIPDKIYDGTSIAATTTAVCNLTGIINSDDVACVVSLANFDTKNAGTNKTVTANSIFLTGVKAENYTLSQENPQTTANITPASLSITAKASSKQYDGTINSSTTPEITAGQIMEGDAAAFIESFDTPEIGSGKLLTPSGKVLDGNNGDNYAVTFVEQNLGEITLRDLFVLSSGKNKVYDGTNFAEVILSTNALPGHLVTATGTANFVDANAAVNKQVNVSDIAISGTDAGYYNLLNTSTTTTANISASQITVIADNQAKKVGDSDPGLSYKITGGQLFGSDTFSGALEREAGETAGKYAINSGSLTAGDNYHIIFTPGNFVIVDANSLVFGPVSNITKEAQSTSGAFVIFTVTASNDTDAKIDPVCDPASGSEFTLGSTTVNCTATDQFNFSTSTSFLVNIVDTTKPVITLNGSSTIELYVGDIYTEASATAEDIADGDITNKIVIGGDSVNTSKPGIYKITYNVKDTSNNQAEEVVRTVTVSDVSGPVIQKIADVQVEATSLSGAVVTYGPIEAVDDVDGTSTPSCLPTSGSQFEIGTTSVICTATDSAGNTGNGEALKVIVEDTTKPVITLTGDANVALDYEQSYTELGASATDNLDGDVTSSIVITGSVNTSMPGTYTINYNVKDSHNNSAEQVSRTVTVKGLIISSEQSVSASTTTSSITVTWTTDHPATSRVIYDLVSHNPLAPDASSPNYGYASSSAEDSALVISHSVTISGLNSSTTYYFRPVSHGSPESVGNEISATTLTPLYNKPVITLNGLNPVIILVGETYNEPGATATDDIDGDLTNQIVTTGTVDSSTAGSYTIYYNVKNSHDVAADTVSRIVDVNKKPQEIQFASLIDSVYSSYKITIYASSTSGLALGFNISGKCTLDGNQIILIGVGECSVTANQEGDNTFKAADSVTKTFSITPANLTITANDQTKTYGSSFTFSGSEYITSGLIGTDNVTLVNLSSSGVSVSASASLSPYDIIPSGAVGSGLENYSITYQNGKFYVNKANQTITFNSLTDKYLGDTDFVLEASSSSNLPVTYSSVGGCSLTGSLVHLDQLGTCTITASQNGDENYNAAENVEQSFNVKAKDTTPPTVTAVDSDGQTFNLNTASPKTIKITFSEDLNNTPTVVVHSVSGTPQTVNNCGDEDAKTWCFNYTINSSESVTHTSYISGGSDAAGNTMTQDTSHTFVVDTVSPSVVLVSATDADGLYRKGQTLHLQVKFNEAVTVTPYYWFSCNYWGDRCADHYEYPQFTIQLNGKTKTLNYTSGSGSDILVFEYAVDDGDVSSDLNYAATDSLIFNGKNPSQVTLKDAAGNSAILTLPELNANESLAGNKDLVINGDLRATVINVTSSKNDGRYKAGDNLEFSVQFNEQVNVSPYVWWVCGYYRCSGNFYEYPKLKLALGSSDRYASYVSGSGSDTLIFNYTVQSGDSTSDLDYLAIDALYYNTKDNSQVTIKDNFGIGANLTLPVPGAEHSLAYNKNLIIDGSAPEFGTLSDLTVKAEGPQGAVVTFDPITASDTIDGIITASCLPNSGSTFALGNTTVTCTATDLAGNIASANFTVKVQDTTKPIINLNGSANITITYGSNFTDPGATAEDDVDGNISNKIVVGGDTVNTHSLGDYTITYNVADSSENAAETVSRTVTVIKADANINISGFEGSYDGLPHSATGSATGSSVEDLSSLLNFGSSFANVPGGIANWTFEGNANYNASSGTASILITNSPYAILPNSLVFSIL